ncbi:MAG: hypothetical protein EBR10_04855 [Planctomycetes bacterium]|nr:hypothetical protein [Planctomycetota bacterium]
MIAHALWPTGCAVMHDVTNDPFELLGIERGWHVDLPQIRAVQMKLLAAHHPDRNLSGVSEADAVAQSARINRAVAILSDPLQRAEALIELGDASGKVIALPQEVLLEMLAKRDALSEATTREEITLCREWIAAERSATEHEMGSVLSSACIDWSAARRLLACLRAIARLDDDARRALAACTGGKE